MREAPKHAHATLTITPLVADTPLLPTRAPRVAVLARALRQVMQARPPPGRFCRRPRLLARDNTALSAGLRWHIRRPLRDASAPYPLHPVSALPKPSPAGSVPRSGSRRTPAHDRVPWWLPCGRVSHSLCGGTDAGSLHNDLLHYLLRPRRCSRHAKLDPHDPTASRICCSSRETWPAAGQ
jgi:hypothetical protein